MNLSKSSTALFVKDIEWSKNFYVNILKMNIDMDFGENVIFKEGFAIWEINENHIIVKTLNTQSNNQNNFELYFETEDIDTVFKTLKDNNVAFLHEIQEEIWGQKTIRFFDPDGHLIEIGEAMAVFVGRFYRQGFSLDEISKKTFVDIKDLKRLLNLEKHGN